MTMAEKRITRIQLPSNRSDLNPVENIKALLNLLFYIEHQTFRCFKDENQIKRTKNTIIAQINRKWYMKGT